MKGNLINISSNTLETIELSEEYFGLTVKKHLVHQAVKRYLASIRRGTADSQERGDVNYSTIKVRPQKGTGRARQGARTSNIWKGGAVAFGPHPRDFSLKMNKKEIKMAIFSALSSRFSDGDVYIVDGIKIEGKTKETVDLIVRVKSAVSKELGRVLFVYADENGEVERSARNISTCKPLNYKFLNAYDLVVFDSIIISREAVNGIERWWGHD
jgi:large subunit ribosomal protein L4